MKIIKETSWATHTFSLCSSGMNSPYYVTIMNGAGQMRKVPAKSETEAREIFDRLLALRRQAFPEG